MSKNLISGIELAYSERTDLIVFALTGRTGSGCSTAATTLGRRIEELTLSDEHFIGVERRKASITTEFARRQWLSFTTITVSSVIYSFVLEESSEAAEKILSELKTPPLPAGEFRSHIESLRQEPGLELFQKAMDGNPRSN